MSDSSNVEAATQLTERENLPQFESIRFVSDPNPGRVEQRQLTVLNSIMVGVDAFKHLATSYSSKDNQISPNEPISSFRAKADVLKNDEITGNGLKDRILAYAGVMALLGHHHTVEEFQIMLQDSLDFIPTDKWQTPEIVDGKNINGWYDLNQLLLQHAVVKDRPQLYGYLSQPEQEHMVDLTIHHLSQEIGVLAQNVLGPQLELRPGAQRSVVLTEERFAKTLDDLSHICHELGSAAAPAKGYLALAEEQVRDQTSGKLGDFFVTDRQQRILNQLVLMVQRYPVKLESILRHAQMRIEGTVPQEKITAKVLEAIFDKDMYAELNRKGITYHFTTSELAQQAEAVCSYETIASLCRNIAENAPRFGVSEVAVSVGIFGEGKDKKEVNPGDKLEVNIEDNGHGFGQKILADGKFIPLMSVESDGVRRGHGRGLSGVTADLEGLHKGSLYAEERKVDGKVVPGARFILLLPVSSVLEAEE
jgi:signal transduction histidine kinase